LSDPHQDSHDELAEGFGFLEELEAQNVQDPASAQEASSVNDVAQSQSLQEEAQTAGSFETLKEGIGLDDEAASGDSDFETHFNMGIAYKEMGLLEDAIREFQDASKFVEPSEKTKRHFECCNLLGLCFMEKGMPNLALLWYKKCLDTEHLTEEERRAVNYEIGNAYEKEGEKRKAAEYFGQIYAFDVDYRDVGERLQRLM
jgi:tetratricopeptide (TPR) repeat protein